MEMSTGHDASTIQRGHFTDSWAQVALDAAFFKGHKKKLFSALNGPAIIVLKYFN